MLHLGIPPDCNVSSSQMHSTEAIIPQVDAKVAAFDVGQGDDEAEANVVRVDLLQCDCPFPYQQDVAGVPGTQRSDTSVVNCDASANKPLARFLTAAPTRTDSFFFCL